MKFKVGDHVRVIAWVPPGISLPTASHIVCGFKGIVEKVRVNESSQNADGEYKVRLFASTSGYWFRPCDLVEEMSECICDSVIRHEPTVECLVHDQADPDPVTNAVASLKALAESLTDEDDE